MKRLTDKHWRNFDPWECCGQDDFCQRGCHDPGGCANGCIVPRLYARLAAYEDTGLEPEEIISALDMAKIACALRELNAYKDLGSIDHIRDLIQAETDGRLQPGQAVCVFIRAILPETLRIKLTVLHPLEALPPQALVYTRTEGHLDLWRYGTPDRAKAVTIF